MCSVWLLGQTGQAWTNCQTGKQWQIFATCSVTRGVCVMCCRRKCTQRRSQDDSLLRVIRDRSTQVIFVDCARFAAQVESKQSSCLSLRCENSRMTEHEWKLLIVYPMLLHFAAMLQHSVPLAPPTCHFNQAKSHLIAAYAEKKVNGKEEERERETKLRRTRGEASRRKSPHVCQSMAAQEKSQKRPTIPAKQDSQLPSTHCNPRCG